MSWRAAHVVYDDSDAYEVLSDKGLKAQYDNELKGRAVMSRPPPRVQPRARQRYVPVSCVC